MIDGPELKRRREAAGITQQDLADQVNITRNALCRAETCTKDPSLATTATIAYVLGCKVDDLLLCRKKRGRPKKNTGGEA